MAASKVHKLLQPDFENQGGSLASILKNVRYVQLTIFPCPVLQLGQDHWDWETPYDLPTKLRHSVTAAIKEVRMPDDILKGFPE
jgi:hypothetical protein